MVIAPGTPCTLENIRDLYMETESRPFIGAECIVVKTTKGGLIQVRLAGDPRRVYSAPSYAIKIT